MRNSRMPRFVRAMVFLSMAPLALTRNAGGSAVADSSHDLSYRVAGVPAACAAPSVYGVVELQGAAGQRVGQVTLVNRGSTSCVLGGMPRISIVQSNGHALKVEQLSGGGAPYGISVGAIALLPGAQAAVPLDWGNYCGRPQGQLHLVLSIARTGTVQARPGGYSGPQLPVPPCLGAGQRSTLRVGQVLPAEGDPAGGVLNYYADVNGHMRNLAYGMLDGPKPSFSKFVAGYGRTSYVSIDLVSTPLYRFHRAAGNYTCVGIHFTALSVDGTRTGFGGYYLVLSRANLDYRLVPSRSTIRQGGAFLLPARGNCGARVP